MEQFPDGAYVRLRSRVLGGYLQADDDGVGVSLSLRRRGPTMNAAWRVHRVLRDDDDDDDGSTYVLLHGAAYGRYVAVAASPDDHRVVQGDYDDRQYVDPLLWVAVGKPDGGYVVVRHASYRLLRANGGHYRLWNNAVSVDDVANYSEMMHWVVEALPTSPTPPELPEPTPNNRGVFRGLFLRQAAEPQRTIRVVLVDDDGNFPMLWTTFRFRGRSVYYLRWEVARHTGNALVASGIVMCVRAGRYGRLTPLVVDLSLPRNEETLDIIVLIAGTPVEIVFAFFFAVVVC